MAYITATHANWLLGDRAIRAMPAIPRAENSRCQSTGEALVVSLDLEHTHTWQFSSAKVESLAPNSYPVFENPLLSYRVPPPVPPVPPIPPGPDGAVGAGPLGGLGLFGPLGGFGLFGPLGGFGLSGPLGGFFGGALRSLGLLGFFGALGLSGLLLPGGFGPLGLFGGLLGVGLPGCCEPCMTAALKPDAPMPGATANAPIEINATDHRTRRKFIVISLDFTLENDAILRCSQQHRHSY